MSDFLDDTVRPGEITEVRASRMRVNERMQEANKLRFALYIAGLVLVGFMFGNCLVPLLPNL